MKKVKYMTLSKDDIDQRIEKILESKSNLKSTDIIQIKEILETIQNQNTELKIRIMDFEETLESKVAQIRASYEENEAKLRIITEEQSLFGILIIADDLVVYANQAMLELSGYTKQEAYKLTIKDILDNTHPEDRKFMAEQYKKKLAREDDAVNRYDIRSLRENGECKWFAYYSEPIIYHGKTAILGMMIDITEKKKIEDQLALSEKRYRGLFDESPIALWEEDFSELKIYFDELKANNVTDIRKYFKDNPDEIEKCLSMIKVTDVNKAALEILQVDDKQPLLKNYDPIYWRDYSDDLLEGICIFFDGALSYEFNSVNYTSDNETRYVTLTAKVVPGCEKNWSRFIISVIDQTDIKNAQIQLEQHRDDLAKAVDAKTKELEKAHADALKQEKFATLGKLISVVSHELLTPLSTIKSSSYTLAKEMKENQNQDAIMRALGRIERGVTRCNLIIEDLLYINTERELMLTKCDLNQLISDVLEDYSLCENIVLNTSLGSEIYCMLDSESMKRCMINLLNNACQSFDSAPRVSCEKLVSISTSKDNEKAYLSVSDTGCGIPEDKIEHIFEPLYSTKNFGAGLGLSIVQHIVEKHNGSVDIQSKLGKGTTVTVSLPVDKSGDL